MPRPGSDVNFLSRLEQAEQRDDDARDSQRSNNQTGNGSAITAANWEERSRSMRRLAAQNEAHNGGGQAAKAGGTASDGDALRQAELDANRQLLMRQLMPQAAAAPRQGQVGQARAAAPAYAATAAPGYSPPVMMPPKSGGSGPPSRLEMAQKLSAAPPQPAPKSREQLMQERWVAEQGGHGQGQGPPMVSGQQSLQGDALMMRKVRAQQSRMQTAAPPVEPPPRIVSMAQGFGMHDDRVPRAFNAGGKIMDSRQANNQRRQLGHSIVLG